MCVPSGCLCALELRKTPPYSIRDPSGQRWEAHGDPSVQSLPSNHFHFVAIFTDKRERRFTCMTLRLDDMSVHNLTHLFNVVWKIVCLKLISKALIQRVNAYILDDYPIHRILCAKPKQWKTFAKHCYIPRHVYVIWIISIHNHLLLQRRNRVISWAQADCTPGIWWFPLWPIHTWRHRVTQADITHSYKWRHPHRALAYPPTPLPPPTHTHTHTHTHDHMHKHTRV